jgi:hypothetical protein
MAKRLWRKLSMKKGKGSGKNLRKMMQNIGDMAVKVNPDGSFSMKSKKATPELLKNMVEVVAPKPQEPVSEPDKTEA